MRVTQLLTVYLLFIQELLTHISIGLEANLLPEIGYFYRFFESAEPVFLQLPTVFWISRLHKWLFVGETANLRPIKRAETNNAVAAGVPTSPTERLSILISTDLLRKSRALAVHSLQWLSQIYISRAVQ